METTFQTIHDLEAQLKLSIHASHIVVLDS